MTAYDRPLRLQPHEITEAERLLGALRNLANPLPSFLYDRYLAEPIDDLETALFDYHREAVALERQRHDAPA